MSLIRGSAYICVKNPLACRRIPDCDPILMPGGRAFHWAFFPEKIRNG